MTDHAFLEYAFLAANKIDPHHTAPNPRVGCVVVKNGKVIAKGAHIRRGKAHAEVNALKRRKKLAGCSVYITLEPCDHFHGKTTGSCTDLLIEIKPEKVVIASLDVRFGGKNVEKLKAAGINVQVLHTDHHQRLNPFYDHWVQTNQPYVTLKIAQSLDGKVKEGKGERKQGSKYISNEASRECVHAMRAQYSAILTTTKTITDDNARLDVRIKGSRGTREQGISNPIVLVLGNKEDIPKNSAFWKVKKREVHFFNTRDLKDVLKQAADLGIDSIMTELGPTVATELLQQSLVDEVVQFIAPSIYGKSLSLATGDVDLTNFTPDTIEEKNGDIMISWKKIAK